MATMENSSEGSQSEGADGTKQTCSPANTVRKAEPNGHNGEGIASAAVCEDAAQTSEVNHSETTAPSQTSERSLGVDDVLSWSPEDIANHCNASDSNTSVPAEPPTHRRSPSPAGMVTAAEAVCTLPPSEEQPPAASVTASVGERTAAVVVLPPEDVADVPHHVKWVKFHGARTAVITQNVNGPCPLLALINVMLLKGKVQLPSALDVVTIGQLMDYVGDAMFDRVPEHAQPDFEHNMQDAVAILPKLQTGLDVNVKFSGVQQFEYTSECCIFDLLHVRLYHGWLVDPADADLHHSVAQCGYNQLVDKIITHKASDDPALAHEALLAEDFLEATASQLTAHGLAQLTATMREGELAVFFRNNHFSTIYKYEGQLYLLVTDQGFLREPGVVWETLSSTTGAGQFVDGSFQPLAPAADQRRTPTPAETARQVDSDFLVALSLQEESTRQQAHELQWEEYKQAEFGSDATVSDAELARRLQEEEERTAREHLQQQQQQGEQSHPGHETNTQSQRSQTDSSARTDNKKRICAVM